MRKKIITLFFFILLFTMIPAVAFAETSGTCGDNLTWTLNDNGTLTISGTGEMWNWDDSGPGRMNPWYSYRSSITNIIINDGVTSIGTYAFWYCNNISKITIPNSIVSIGQLAFCECSSMTNIEIPENVTKIGDSAFCACTSLTSIEIPNSVENIGETIFSRCTALKSISVSQNNANYASEEGILFNKNLTCLIEYPEGKTGSEYYIPESVTSIESDAFSNCKNLTTIKIPNSVKIIEEWAFSGCSCLISIEIPGSVTNINLGTFSGCSNLMNALIPESVTTIGASAFNGCSSLSNVYYAGTETQWSGITIESFNEPLTDAKLYFAPYSGICGTNLDWTFNNGVLTISGTGPMADYTYASSPWHSLNSAITKVIIEDGVTSIGNSAFWTCANLTEVKIPNGITTIGKNAFSSSGLKSVSIPDSVISIGESAFSSCTSLESVILGNKLTSIGSYSFFLCSGLKNVSTLPGSLTAIGEIAFGGCESLESINVDSTNLNYCSVEGVLFNKEKTELIQCPGTLSGTYSIPSGIKKIGTYAFCKCKNLTEIVLPESVSSIESFAFSGCSSIQNFSIPESVTSIEDNTFSYCKSLESITIPENVVSIKSGAFTCCENLASITIPESVENIGDSAFYNCIKLKSIVIPKSVTSIGSSAFMDDKALKSFKVDEDNPNYCSVNGMLFNKDKTILIQYPAAKSGNCEIPSTVTTISNGAFRYCENLSKIVIPEGVKSIGSSTFLYCTGLKSITLPKCITTIGRSAFYGCSKLTYIDIPEGVTLIDQDVFNGCSSLQQVTFPTSLEGAYANAFKDCSSLSDVYYIGTETQWVAVKFGQGNDAIENAAKHFNSPESHESRIIADYQLLRQTYFSGGSITEEDLYNATDIENVKAEDLPTAEMIWDGDLPNEVIFSGLNLKLNEDNTVTPQAIFLNANPADEISIYMNETPNITKTETGYIIISPAESISISDLTKVYTITIAGATISFNAMTYIKMALNSSEQSSGGVALRTLMQALTLCYQEITNNMETYVKSTDRYLWPFPASNYISSTMKQRWGTFHSGIDIDGNGLEGSVIVAADGGTVILAGWNGGYGNCVIIDHGDNCYTLYGHLEAMNVSQGQTVIKGQSIGYCGSSGSEEGPSLHYEIRIGGSGSSCCVDPLQYYSGYVLEDGAEDVS